MSAATGAEAPDLVVFAPLPPSPSGIAAYTAELLPELARLGRRPAVVVARDADIVPPPEGAAAVLSERGYRARPALHALPHLHQLGNSLDHAHVYRAALRRPGGVVVLHDVVLHHLVEALTLGRGDDLAYEAVLAHEHGPAGQRLARLRRRGLFTPIQRFLLPLHRHVLEQAGAVVVHSHFAAGRLLAPPDLPVHIMPHHVPPAVARYDGVTRDAARARLGLPADAPLLLALGHATAPKRLEAILEALALLRAAGNGPEARLVIGGPADPALPLAPRIAALGLQDRVILTGWLPEEAFFLHLRATDLLLALRFPVAGESSGTLARALGMGTPALVHDFGPAAEYPDTVVAKLPFAPEIAPPLAARIAALLGDRGRLAALGAAARTWTRRHCRVADSARSLIAALPHG